MEPDTSADKLDFSQLFATTRARVYFVWLVIVVVGFVATHFHQENNINALWFFLSVFGLGYMYKTMPMRVKQMRNIFLAWLIPIVFGMVISAAAFYINPQVGGYIIANLGAIWMIIMAIGFAANGAVDPPGRLYWMAVAANLAGGIACFMFDSLVPMQYVIAAIVSGWSMLSLWLFRAS